MKGLLLINLGTPKSPAVADVRAYLREFLSDPFVIDINPVLRWALVNAVIAPFRSPRSALAYQKIWMPEGSPLLVHSQKFADKVRQKMAPDTVVELGMRYGAPSILDALKKLFVHNLDSLTVFPLYPQYALSSTETAIDEVKKYIDLYFNKNRGLNFIAPFYASEIFLKCIADQAQGLLAAFKPDFHLFSYHGLPERQVLKALPQDYRQECRVTADGVARLLGLPKEAYSISFQSRLGRTPWIQPFTDQVIPQLAREGKKRLAVFCPSFVADCLETLEEIGIRARELFIQAGGEDLLLVPSLNDGDAWVDAAIALCKKSA